MSNDDIQCRLRLEGADAAMMSAVAAWHMRNKA